MRTTAIVLLTLLLAACGFHLAGNRPLPDELKSVYINVTVPYRVSEPPLETYLRAALLRRGGQVRGDADGDITVIRLSDLQETRTLLSMGPDGKALEYQLTTTVRYQVTRGNKLLLPVDVLSASRDYSYNAQQVLAKEAEELRLRDFIQNELAELLLLRLETTLSQPQPVAAPAGSVDAAPAAAPASP